jgi:hypothetical protein
MSSSQDDCVVFAASDEMLTRVSNVASEVRSRSPLWMVSQEPLLNDLVVYLDTVREQLNREPHKEVQLLFSRQHLKKCRAAFDRMIRRGEENLHRLCEMLCDSLVGNYQLQSVVIGAVPTTGERFTLTQPISQRDLYSTIDLDLGNRQLRKLKYFDGASWVGPMLIANVVEYQPIEPNQYGVFKLISRIKAEEELWNKVVDEIFGLDSLVKRDKQLRHLSHYVKDIFGIKIVVGTAQDALVLHESLEKLRWDEDGLKKLEVEALDGADRLKFLETKNYLQDHEKSSGWEAIKSVVMWNSRMFEIQIQPLANFWSEREHLTRESHAGFKSRREQIRQQVAEQIPLFRFYQNLLRWFFQNPESPAPVFSGVSLAITE